MSLTARRPRTITGVPSQRPNPTNSPSRARTSNAVSRERQVLVRRSARRSAAREGTGIDERGERTRMEGLDDARIKIEGAPLTTDRRGRVYSLTEAATQPWGFEFHRECLPGIRVAVGV